MITAYFKIGDEFGSITFCEDMFIEFPPRIYIS